MKSSERDHQDPINSPNGAEMGFHRLRFRRDAPQWFIRLVFACVLGTLVACLLLSR